MAVSILNKEIHDIKLVYTYATPTGQIDAHKGASATLTPTKPSGYKFLTHIAVWNTGVVGVVVAFDDNATPSETAKVYQNNTANNTQNRGRINLLTAYYR